MKEYHLELLIDINCYFYNLISLFYKSTKNSLDISEISVIESNFPTVNFDQTNIGYNTEWNNYSI